MHVIGGTNIVANYIATHFDQYLVQLMLSKNEYIRLVRNIPINVGVLTIDVPVLNTNISDIIKTSKIIVT